MKKIVPIALGVMVIALIYVRLTAFRPRLTEMTIGNTKIQVDVADTVGKQQRGLSGRPSLPQNQGMLFIFSNPSIYMMWMQGMQFPLDFIWIRDGRVVDITENVPYPVGDNPPVRIQPKEFVSAVLEVNAGFVQRKGIKIGDEVRMSDRTNTN